MKKYLLIIITLIISYLDIFAGAGIFRTEIRINGTNYVMYDNNAVQAVNGTFITGSPFANGASVTLNGGVNKTFKDGGTGNICNGTLAYRVFLVGNTPGVFTDINLPFGSNDGGNNNQTWQTTGANVPLPSTVAGTYKVEFYFRADGSSSNGSSCSEQFYQSNGGFNFTLQYTINAPLPVIFTTFKANAEGQIVNLEWGTAQEFNNSYFEVERSKDTQTWEMVGSKEGSGSSKLPKSYSMTDYNARKGTNYYRLSQIDTDGTRSFYSRIQSAIIEVNPDLIIFPNPTTEMLKLSGINEDAQVSIYDFLGNLKVEKKVTSIDSNIKLLGLLDGIYIVKIQDETTTKMIKILVRK
jgi:Secretion system C-terminal sorting domain